MRSLVWADRSSKANHPSQGGLAFPALLLVDIMDDQGLHGFPVWELIAPKSQVEDSRGYPCTCIAVGSQKTDPELYPITRGHMQRLER